MSPTQFLPLSAEIIRKAIEETSNFVIQSGAIINSYHFSPASNSLAYQEMTNFIEPSLIEDLCCRTALCFENAADHLMAFISIIKEPAKTLAPYSCIRSLLESCSLALWLLDLNIDAKERVGRCFGYRFREFEEQIKFLNSRKVRSIESQHALLQLQRRIVDVEAKAIALGYPKLHKNGKITGIALHMPEMVRLIIQVLDKESDYRLLSAVTHSYLWASRQIGFQLMEETSEDGQKSLALKKHVHPEMVLYGFELAVPTVAKLFWVTGRYYGWGMNEIEELLDQTYDKMEFDANMRFWRHPYISC